MFVAVMGPTADELHRLADEARACRERLQALLRVTAELKQLLAPLEAEAAAEAAVKLQSVS
jgi:hypothetical protein